MHIAASTLVRGHGGVHVPHQLALRVGVEDLGILARGGATGLEVARVWILLQQAFMFAIRLCHPRLLCVLAVCVTVHSLVRLRILTVSFPLARSLACMCPATRRSTSFPIRQGEPTRRFRILGSKLTLSAVNSGEKRLLLVLRRRCCLDVGHLQPFARLVLRMCSRQQALVLPLDRLEVAAVLGVYGREIRRR